MGVTTGQSRWSQQLSEFDRRLVTFDNHGFPRSSLRGNQEKKEVKDYDYGWSFTPYRSELLREQEQSEHLVDLPQDLQELQQQLLEAAKVEVTHHDLEVDPGTGWPWYVATIPPGDFYDCLFLYFSCS